jgi:hypothetical protein
MISASARTGIVATLLALAAAGCGGGGGGTGEVVEETLTFEVERNIAEERIPGSEAGGPLEGLAGARGDLDVRVEIEERSISEISEIRFRGMTLHITPTAVEAGDSDDFDFVDSVEVFVEGPEGSALPRLQIASRQGVPDGMTELEVPPVGQPDLLPYVDAGGFLTLHATGMLPPDDVTFDGTFVLAIEAI